MNERPSLRRNIAAGILGAGINRGALHVAVRQQAYQASASAMGVGPEEAARALGEVVTELSQTGAPGDPFAIAQRRLAEGANFRPPEQLREAARQILAAGGYSLHPEHVDAYAGQLQRVVDTYAPRLPWYKRWWRRLRKMLRRKAA